MAGCGLATVAVGCRLRLPVGLLREPTKLCAWDHRMCSRTARCRPGTGGDTGCHRGSGLGAAAPRAPRACQGQRDRPDRRAVQRVREAKGGLHGRGRRPAPAPGHTPPAPRPKALKSRRRRHSPVPLAEVEVPERMVDPGRLPVDDAGQPAAVGQQLIVVDVAVDQDRRELGGAGQ